MINFTVTEKEINEYNQAQPFPHIVIDNFLPPSILNGVIDDFRNHNDWGWDNSQYSQQHQVKKFFSPWNENGNNILPINTKLILNYLNSPETISMLEKLTGIDGLIADPTLLGGGMHKIDSGGKLSIHADSRKHAVTGNYRRINLLVYLNKNWNSEWGGSLQLWNNDMTTMVQDIQPFFNRVVIFNTGGDTYHGHPHVLNTPEGVSRISLALYYYTKENPDTDENNVTSAVWKDVPSETKQITPTKVIKDGPTMCFATMCKNEEHCIQNTLESVYKHIDYWVVCDTGSTDRTCEIVKNFFEEKGIPGELHVDKWVGFDHNKSLMMERAKDKTDYVLHLDADDLLINGLDFGKNDIGDDAYFMNVTRGTLKWMALIIFNNRLTWRFCGVAHTTIKCKEKESFTTKDISNRNSYVSGEGIGSRAFDPKKFLYDAEKLKKQFFDTLLSDPDNLNSRSAFYTGQSYQDYGMLEEAIKWYRLYTKLDVTWFEEIFECNMRIAYCMMKLNYKLSDIESQMSLAINIEPDRAEPYYFMGKHCNEIGEYEKAYNYLRAAKSRDYKSVKEKYRLFIQETMYGIYNNDELSVACFWSDRFDEGYKYLLEILNDERFSSSKDRLLTNQKHFQDRMGVLHN
jgi:Rps23 Pro-64 3,4-dihydroxylase Tpa1-like proline 4-hydroxylase/glycosyltransferase involved in cell wall biosynthesis